MKGSVSADVPTTPALDEKQERRHRLTAAGGLWRLKVTF